MVPFSEAHNIDIFGAQHNKSVWIYRAEDVCLVHKTMQYGDFG